MTCPKCAPYVGKGRRVFAEWPVRVSAGEPTCAFNDEGNFKDLNWDCQTMASLRAHPFATETHSEDQTILVIPFSGEFVVLGFYKHRGRVETAIHVDEYEHAPLTLGTALRLLGAGNG